MRLSVIHYAAERSNSDSRLTPSNVTDSILLQMKRKRCGLFKNTIEISNKVSFTAKSYPSNLLQVENLKNRPVRTVPLPIRSDQ